ncbi:MAG: hypothetical protein M9885_03175 [Burkholderiaceae bacterium]|nr:hypothetical protein [Burkholderiaceae bacterium]
MERRRAPRSRGADSSNETGTTTDAEPDELMERAAADDPELLDAWIARALAPVGTTPAATNWLQETDCCCLRGEPAAA